MIVNCEHCHAGYDVSAAAIGAGRNLRCVECGKSWWQEPKDEKGVDEHETGVDERSGTIDVIVVAPAGVGETRAVPTIDPESMVVVSHRDEASANVTDLPLSTEQPTIDGLADVPVLEVTHDQPVRQSNSFGRLILMAAFFVTCAAAFGGMVYYMGDHNPLARQVITPVISVLSTDAVDEGRNVRVSMRITNPSDVTVNVPAISVSVNDATGRERTRRRLPAPIGALRPKATVDAAVSIPRVDRGERMRVGFVRS